MSAAARAKVICQNCLAPGHWTYECKATSTYQVRPSRTKQLRQKRFRQDFMEEEAPAVPKNVFLGEDRQREPEPEVQKPPEKMQKTEEGKAPKNSDEAKKKKKKKKKKESSSSSSSSSDSSSSSSSS
mmetsp:Transcript_41142/g.74318  ORF Transcript_41142/g.74318 Transcript_41142/m.74318 type:complete len:127 (+) Transcript_41142:74-454(+)